MQTNVKATDKIRDFNLHEAGNSTVVIESEKIRRPSVRRGRSERIEARKNASSSTDSSLTEIASSKSKMARTILNRSSEMHNSQKPLEVSSHVKNAKSWAHGYVKSMMRSLPKTI